MHGVDLNLNHLQSFRREIAGWFRRINDHTPIQRLPVSHIERRFKAFRSSLGKPKRTISRERFWRGTLLMLLGALLAFIAFAAIFTRLKYMHDTVIYFVGSVVTWIAVVLLGLVGVFLALYLLHLARAMFYPGVEDLLKVDRRQPIVFLRAFYDDSIHFAQDKFDWASIFRNQKETLKLEEFIQSLWRSFRDRVYTKRKTEMKEPGIRVEKMRFENVIHKQLRQLGPVIAIGRPGERLPYLAAARKHFADDEWKDAILTWLERARTIVIVAGYSEGIKWEIEQITLKGYTKKVLVLLPPKPIRLITSLGAFWEYWKSRNADHRRERWAVICEKFVPEASRRALRRMHVNQLIAFHLAPDGQPVLIRGKQHTASAYQLAIRVAIYGMHCRQDSPEIV